MTDINSVVLVGRLTRDMELKFLNNGTAVGRFSIAVNKKFKDKEEVSFFDIVVWSKLAEVLNKYITKGSQVIVSGELMQNRWEQDGNSRSKVEINASSVQMIGGKESSQPSNIQQPRSHGGNPPAYQAGPESFEDDSIPF